MKIVRADDAPPLFDLNALQDEVDAMLRKHSPSSPDARNALLSRLKEVVADSRSRAEDLLLSDGGGLACAQRLSNAQDDLIRLLMHTGMNYFYPVTNLSDGERLTVCAVGGYGRGTLAPGSDIDLLFLRPYKATAWSEQIVEHILYMLWDLGFKVGHATRTVGECVRLALSDMTIRTALLERRVICGDQGLFQELNRAYEGDVMANTAAEFVEAKLAERDSRLSKAGQSRYRVEPNVKEGKGGLRDLNTLFWIARYVYVVNSGDELVKAGAFTRKEYNTFRKSEDFLWATRCHLHFLNRRADDRLSFDVQADIARRLGYVEHPGLRDVERFMKHYFLVAKDVGDLTRILCARLEDSRTKTRPILDRMMGSLRPSRKLRKVPGSKDFVIDNGRINLASEDVFQNDPVNLLRFFHLADKHDLDVHPEAAHRVTRSLRLVNAALRENKQANAVFLEILCSRNKPEATLRRMNETGLLGKFVPDFGKIVAMMQFNMYHHYTVDEHTLYCLGILSSIERGELGDEHPLADTIAPTIENRRVLYVALFLHDIAKGRPEDHSVAGAKVARKLCPRLGLDENETNMVVWLVREHLTMSMMAQSRDLSDRKTISDFAEVVQDMERLKLLLTLTVCDIKGVGPGVWNGWKGQLLRTLYYETEVLLTGGFIKVGRENRVKAEQVRMNEALQAQGWSHDDIERYEALHYPPYWLRTDFERKLDHAALMRDGETKDGVLASSRTYPFEGVTEMTVVAPDHPRLLSVISGACTLSEADIVDAQVHTMTDGRALDAISIRRAFNDDEAEMRRANRIIETIRSALTGQLDMETELKTQPKPSARTKAFKVPAAIIVDNSASDQFTMIEASGKNRAGLLHALTSTLASLSLDIGSAHITTFGERAVDVFYVTDLMGEKITNGNRINTIRRKLSAVFDDKAGAKSRQAA